MRKLQNKYAFDFILLGIVSPDKDYVISHKINQNIGVKLSAQKDLIIENTKLEINQAFPLYSCLDEFLIEYRLIKNLGCDGYLFPENKNLDYFIQIIGDITDEKIQSLLSKINSIDTIQTTMIIETSKIKTINKLYFQILYTE